ncbi:hypothetical protein IQ273_32155 [Nodosilinea sp. LEGE 07298]|uniref:hypothetical protein n=1 Tax=Nodosilinea sp. LEGE 07298 TaxID=2777970 RepID=UPI00188086A1|nr:hypothetical protein [Nodosilinea sp. LEGE 07298]MBE9114023.1 hypothetical protein [Nodosilinea sp. LEGE 07298]
MSTQQITIELPEPVMRQLMRIAAATHQSIEALVAQSVLSNLPPSVDNAPPELQTDLLSMQGLSVKELYTIAQTQTEPIQYNRHTELLQKNAANQLTPAERQELSALRQSADHLMLCKAYAWSLLRWRGQKIPALADLPVPV